MERLPFSYIKIDVVVNILQGLLGCGPIFKIYINYMDSIHSQLRGWDL